MDLTVVIVNWNGGEVILRCLRSIRASRTSFTVRTIVVDNDSSDGSREAAQREFPEFEIFNSGANLGFGRACNLGRSRTETPLVLFLNPDVELRPDTLEIAVRCLEGMPKVGALGCRMRGADGAVQGQGLQWAMTPWRAFVMLLLVRGETQSHLSRWLPVHDPNRSGSVAKLNGGFVLVRKEALDRVGWFDERYFMYAEDADLSRALQDAGWALYYTVETEVTHAARASSGKAMPGFGLLMKHESIVKLIRKYQGPFASLRYRAAILVGAAIRLLILLVLFPVARVRSAASATSHQISVAKHWLMVLWALGVRKPRIPSNPAPTATLGALSGKGP